MGFELPKPLAVSDVAVRLLHTRYDHLFIPARMVHQRMHTPSHRSDAYTSFITVTIVTFSVLVLLSVSFCLVGYRSLAGNDEIAADTDFPAEGETKVEVKEESEMQSETVDEEEQLTRSSEGQKV